MHLCFICTPVLVADHALPVADCRQYGKWRPGDNLQQIWSKVRTGCDATCSKCRDIGPHICGRHGTLSSRRSLTSIVRGSLFSCSLCACLLHLKKRQDPTKARIPGCTHQKGAYHESQPLQCFKQCPAVDLLPLPLVEHCVWSLWSCQPAHVPHNASSTSQMGVGEWGGRTSFPTHMSTLNCTVCSHCNSVSLTVVWRGISVSWFIFMWTTWTQWDSDSKSMWPVNNVVNDFGNVLWQCCF